MWQPCVGDDSEISTALASEKQRSVRRMPKHEDTIVKISDCLSEQVPEIDDWCLCRSEE